MARTMQIRMTTVHLGLGAAHTRSLRPARARGRKQGTVCCKGQGPGPKGWTGIAKKDWASRVRQQPRGPEVCPGRLGPSSSAHKLLVITGRPNLKGSRWTGVSPHIGFLLLGSAHPLHSLARCSRSFRPHPLIPVRFRLFFHRWHPHT